MDSKLSTAQADPHHDGDVVSLAPKDWTDAEAALSKLAHVASDRRRPTAGSDFSAGQRVTEPPLDATLRPAGLNPARLNNDPPPTDRPLPKRRTMRSLARFLVMAGVGAAAILAWQSYGGGAKQMIASAAPQLGWLLSSPPAPNPPPDGEIAVEQPGPLAVAASAPQAASAQAGAVVPTASETAAPTAPAAASPELQQIETMAHELAAVQQSVEQLAAGQEQMAREIANLQRAGQDIRRRISALPPAPAAAARKPGPPPQPAPQSSAASLPPAPAQPAPQPSGATPPAPSEPALRPPMPVR